MRVMHYVNLRVTAGRGRGIPSSAPENDEGPPNGLGGPFISRLFAKDYRQETATIVPVPGVSGWGP
jgi:hypothetical protein